MVTRSFEWILASLENLFVIVLDVRNLSVHQLFGPYNFAAERIAHALMAQANPEDRDCSGIGLDKINGDPGVFRPARSRRNDDLLRPQGIDLLERDLIIADHFQISP